ncbi:LysM peptidoglycan-binding domain-containing protein [Kitasatospora sp. NBC_00070]|uniref:LysM peptidoglycan-binding domain-containing protein n=1 Tax=Kitasatospora sp. NBC_00070 TaxID=2975962 RepID=UPI00324777EE
MAGRRAKEQHRAGTGTNPPAGRRPVPLRPNRRRTAGSVFAALGALVLLALLLVGVPALLLYGTTAVAGMGGQSTSGPVELLTTPDDGRIFLWALVAIGWVGWLCFAFSVLLEIPAQLRGRVARRLPAFGWSQRIAAGLVGSVLALLPVAGSAFAAVPDRPAAVAPAQVTAAPQYAALPAAPVAPALTPAADPAPGYTVQDSRPADSLWSIAERQLGSGERWVEIAKLNNGRVMDDSGRTFDADRPIHPGWQLLMPGDAKAQGGPAPAPAPAPQAPAPQHGSVTVRAGDTLSAIAERELGDAEGWPKLFEANKGVAAPDGERLTDPDVVVPGMVLAIPGAPAPAPVPAPEPAPVPVPDVPVTPDPAPATPAPATPAPATQGPVVPSQAPTPAAHTPAAHNPAEAAAPSDDYSVALAASTVGVLLAAVLVGTVARRRGAQQRSRKPRHRIALPAPAALAFESELKVRQDDAGLALLDRALRTMARNTVRGGKRLPALIAARITPGRTVELHLAAPAAPIAPFRAAHAPNVWWCPDDSSELLGASQAAKNNAPYPALVTLGSAPDGSVVLADLETVRLMHLSGHPDDSQDVLRTLAVELAHSPLADRLNLHLVGLAEDLPISGPALDRVHRHDSLEAAIAALGPRTARARATLVAAEATSPRDARSRGQDDESWVPEIVLSAQPPSGSLPTELGRLLDGTPRTCLAVVTRAPERGSGPVARWTLPSTGNAVIPGLHLTVQLQRLSPDQYAQLGDLLRSSADTAQLPAPDWTLDGVELEPSELPLPVPVLAGVGASGPTAAEAAAIEAVSRVIGTGSSPFAGVSPAATPRHSANSVGLHVKSADPVHPVVPVAPAVAAVVPVVVPAPAPEPDPEPVPTHEPAAPVADTTPARPVPPPVTASTPAPRTDSDDLLAILRSPEAHSVRTAPRIRLLGPPDVLGTTGSVTPEGRPRLTELAALLALRPGADQSTLDRALHPGAAHLDPHPTTTEHTVTPMPVRLAELAGWLGESTEGRAFLPLDGGDGHTFAPTVSCDWDEFRSLYRRGMRSTSSTADAALAHALALVRGAPFAEAPGSSYGWAEPERQDMIATIVDTAHELAARRLQYGDHRTAEAAIFRGLAVAPDIELLHRDLFYAYASAGARDQLVRAVNRLDALSRRTGRDLDPDTVALLRDLLSGA